STCCHFFLTSAPQWRSASPLKVRPVHGGSTTSTLTHIGGTEMTEGNGTVLTEGGRRRILLVDDTADIRVMLRLQLQMGGVDFQEASSGEEALAMCAGDPFDLIVLDHRMPGLT